jgi:hypothetical protein
MFRALLARPAGWFRLGPLWDGLFLLADRRRLARWLQPTAKTGPGLPC